MPEADRRIRVPIIEGGVRVPLFRSGVHFVSEKGYTSVDNVPGGDGITCEIDFKHQRAIETIFEDGNPVKRIVHIPSGEEPERYWRVIRSHNQIFRAAQREGVLISSKG